MPHKYFLSCLSKNRSFQILREFINISYGFHLSLVDYEGNEVLAEAAHHSKSKKSVDKNDGFPIFNLEGRRKTHPPQKIPFNVKLLEKFESCQKAKIIECDRFGYKQIIVPIIKGDAILGFVFMSENMKMRLREDECEAMKALIHDFIERLIKSELKFAEHFQDQHMTHQQKIIKEVLEYVHENYQSPYLTLKDISAKKGVSYHYLSHLFKKELNISFKSYLQKIRLQVAAKLLKSKNLSIGQVAYQCGFDDPGYFTKTFKGKIGVVPGDYRNSLYADSRAKSAKIIELAESAR